jgi:hypothetical protein
MGLGGLAKVSLATARDMAAEARKTLALGLDPIAEKRRRQSEREQEHSRAKTFGEFADEYIAEHEKGWRNAKHRQQWRNTLTTHASANGSARHMLRLGLAMRPWLRNRRLEN